MFLRVFVPLKFNEALFLISLALFLNVISSIFKVPLLIRAVLKFSIDAPCLFEPSISKTAPFVIVMPSLLLIAEIFLALLRFITQCLFSGV